jgi:hypothetical protein
MKHGSHGKIHIFTVIVYVLQQFIIYIYRNTKSSLRRCPGISWTLVVNSREAVCSFPLITSAINGCRPYMRGYGTVA